MKYFVNEKKREVIAVSTYAGKTVRGVARCADIDEFSLSTGKRLAEARLDVKVSEKRVNRANRKMQEAIRQVDESKRFLNKMMQYSEDSNKHLAEAKKILENLEKAL